MIELSEFIFAEVIVDNRRATTMIENQHENLSAETLVFN